jgi:hypothetical protein
VFQNKGVTRSFMPEIKRIRDKQENGKKLNKRELFVFFAGCNYD